MTQTRSWWRGGAVRAVAGAVTVAMLALAAAGCSGSDRPEVMEPNEALAQIVAANAAAEGYTLTGTLRAPGGDEVEVTGSVTPEPVAAGEGEVRAGALVSGGVVPLHAVWKDASVYLERTVTPGAGGAGAAVFLQRTEGEKPWLRIPAGPLTDPLYAAFVPGEVLAVLDGRDVAMRTLEGDGLRVVTDEPVTIGSFVAATVTLWASPAGVLERIEIEADAGSLDYRLKAGPVGAAPVPPPGEVAEPGQGAARPTGPFVTDAQGTTNGVAWVVAKAPGGPGVTCWRVQTTPAIELVQPGPQCVPDGEAADPIGDRVWVIAASAAAARQSLVVITSPEPPQAGRIGFVGSPALQNLPGASLAGPVVFVGARAPRPGLVQLDYEGGTVACGAGAVSTPGDLGDSTLTENVGASPWLCETDEG